MDPTADAPLQPAVAAEFLALADLLETQPDAAWDVPSLCTGWRVREVVAHITMPVRYSNDEFMAELEACHFDLTRLSNQVASRDGELTRSVLVEYLRNTELHHWFPPGGNYAAALTHVVIHGLDITEPLGTGRVVTDESIGSVLDELTHRGAAVHFDFDLDGLHLQATDLDWSFGTGSSVRATAGDLALLITGRARPEGRVEHLTPL